MQLLLIRISTGKESTLGVLYINGDFACHTLEDTKQDEKVQGQTRIPSGRYFLKLRNEGGLTKKYSERYGEMHRGMIWLQNVPGFQWVYIHTGNKAEHSEGCILVGDRINNNQIEKGILSASRQAYQRIYPRIAGAVEVGEEVALRICELG